MKLEQRRIAGWWLWVSVLWVTAVVSVGCSTNPATGRAQLNILSESEEISLGREAAPGFLEQYGGSLPDEQIVAHVRQLGQQLAAVSERSQLPWEFHVVDSSVINAFALPGGKVFISRGLLERMTNEAQLAGVLGHEVGHVTAQHIGQQMTQAMGIQIGLIAAGIAIDQATDDAWLATLGLVGGELGAGMYLLKYGRDQEHQADELGLRYMTRLGYDPLGQVQVMRILKDASGGGGGIEMLSTHPLPESRIERLVEMIAERYPGSETSAYGFGEARFRREVLDRLEALPPARHPAKGAAAWLPAGLCACGGVHAAGGG
ncbi:M48 family metallopeptidase [Mucisphaera calidilacus]|uniref:TPR repeat-containing protein YfgC n=1 Tax=Mucisphaera calidilacus TaxID=2527982 RepID=A0A518BWP7_9BACT|nr:M48 family metallopeptidase [Mucisphaera calidilacus]QDU71403.1 TPR repeat-containing protein YfgC precursor [Mucisphaera calidilacus]